MGTCLSLKQRKLKIGNDKYLSHKHFTEKAKKLKMKYLDSGDGNKITSVEFKIRGSNNDSLSSRLIKSRKSKPIFTAMKLILLGMESRTSSARFISQELDRSLK